MVKPPYKVQINIPAEIYEPYLEKLKEKENIQVRGKYAGVMKLNNLVFIEGIKSYMNDELEFVRK